MSAYQTIANAIAELKQYADTGNWEKASRISDMVQQTLQSAQFPPAVSADRALLERSLADIARIQERAAPLRQDIAALLAAFDKPPAAP
jgi:hypothetical protein